MSREKLIFNIPADLDKVLAIFGWATLAIECGSLNFRPIISLAGPPGSGKTTLLQKIASLIPGAVLLESPTEASIRELLDRHGASVPYLLDGTNGMGAVVRLLKAGAMCCIATSEPAPESRMLSMRDASSVRQLLQSDDRAVEVVLWGKSRTGEGGGE